MSIYVYNATMLNIVDGDTVDLRIDLGFRSTLTDRFRLYGIDTPEVNRVASREAGQAASAFLAEMIPLGAKCKVKTMRDRKGKYGRYLAVLMPLDGNPLSANERLVQAGHAERVEY